MNTSVPQTGLRVSIDPHAPRLLITDAPEPAQPRPRKRALLHQSGSVTVRIRKTSWYSKQHRKKYHSFTLSWRDVHGRRRREKRATLDLAKKRADAIAQDIQTGEAILGNFGQAQRASFSRGLELLAKIDSPPLEVALGIYTHCVQKLRSAGLTEAAVEQAIDFFLENRPRGALDRNVPDVVDEMFVQMELNQEGERWIDDLRSRLTPQEKKWIQPVKPFTRNFTGPVHGLRAPALNEWLEKLQLSGRSRNNYRCAILALVAFAKEKKYLPRAWSEMEEVKIVELKRKRIRIYTPEQGAAFLKAARPKEIPFMAIQAFAGVRTREIKGDKEHPPLTWQDVRIRQRQIYIPPESAKKGTPDRIIPISENLAAWLAPYARRSGPVCAIGNLTNALRATAERAGVPFIRNGFRKSFISYRLAVIRDIGRVADEAGNSPYIIKKDYRDVREEEEGLRWFGIGTLQLSLGLQEEEQAAV